jgi:hypothetical protein
VLLEQQVQILLLLDQLGLLELVLQVLLGQLEQILLLLDLPVLLDLQEHKEFKGLLEQILLYKDLQEQLGRSELPELLVLV